MTRTIEISNTSPNKFWINFINHNRWENLDKSVKVVQFDFSKCTFIEPFYIVALSCLIEEYFIKGVVIELLKCPNLELNEYLEKINFYNYWEEGFDRNSYTPNKITTNLCLWKLRPEMISSYVLQAQKYFESNFLSNISFAPLNISLAELFNNISDHSSSSVSGYSISQYYPNIKKIKIAICDFGAGIPSNVNEFFVNSGGVKIPDGQAILKAIEKSFSTKTHPHNRGFGLDTIKSIVLNCNGSLKILSNKGYYELNLGIERINNIEKSFIGTHIEIILDASTFDEIEDDFIGDKFTF